ncbi:MAG: 2,3-bisphosphoglycerate-dependent phosphoglycerate mutase [Ilumatobacteraceae bacterium]
MTGSLVLLRHGQSTWNELNLFTGWHDVPLSPTGIKEARHAGATMRQAGLHFDAGHTSLLNRAIETSRLALHELGQDELEVRRDWRLNERHYGALQGLDKRSVTALYGAEQTEIWRRSFDTAPPPIERSNPDHPLNDPRYIELVAEGFDPKLLPTTECLKDVLARVVPFFDEIVAPQLADNLDVLVTAHGNSLRALFMHLDGVSSADIAKVNIPTGVPRLYTFGAHREVSTVRYLGDPEKIAAAMLGVSKQSSP